MGVSFNPKDAVVGGGLLDDEDIKVIKSRFAMFDYNGTQTPAPAIKWVIDRLDGSDPIEQYWTVGKGTDWMPTDDGKGLEPIGRATQLVNSSNGMLLLNSLINAGTPSDVMGEDISVFDGLECHVNRVAADRKGMDNKNSKGRELTVLTVTKIHKAPWDEEKSKSKNKTKGKGKGKGTDKAEESGPTLEEKATEFLIEVLTDPATTEKYPDGIPKAKLPPLAFSKFPADNPDRSGIVATVFKDEFLSNGPWNYSGGKLSM